MHFISLALLLHLNLGTITSSLRSSIIAPGTSCNSLSGCLRISSYRPKSQLPTEKDGRLSTTNTWSPVGNLKVTLNDQRNKSKKQLAAKFNKPDTGNAGVSVYANDHLFDSSTVVGQDTVANPWIRYWSYQPATVATLTHSSIKRLTLSKNKNLDHKTINSENERNGIVSFDKQNIDSNLKRKSFEAFNTSKKNKGYVNANRNGVNREFLNAQLQSNSFPYVDTKYYRKQTFGTESIINISNGYPDRKSFGNILRNYSRKNIDNFNNETDKNHGDDRHTNDKNIGKKFDQYNKFNKFGYQEHNMQRTVLNKEKKNIDQKEKNNFYDINLLANYINRRNISDQHNNDDKFRNQNNIQNTITSNERRNNSKVLNKTIIFDYLRKLFNDAERLFHVPQIESGKSNHENLNILSENNTNDLNSKFRDLVCRIMHCQRSNEHNINRYKEVGTDQQANQLGLQVLRSLDDGKSGDYLENNSNSLPIISSTSFEERKRNESSAVSILLDSSDKISAINGSSKSNQTALKESDEFTPAGSLKSRTKSRENDLIPGDLAKKRKKSALQIYSQDSHDKRPGILKRKNAAILQLNFDIKVPKEREENVYFRLKFPKESLRKSQDQSERNVGDVNYKKAAEPLQNKITLTFLKEKSNDTSATTEVNRWLEINTLTDKKTNSIENKTNSVFKINGVTKLLQNISLFFIPSLRTSFSGIFKLPVADRSIPESKNESGILNVDKITGNGQNIEHLLSRKKRHYNYYSQDKNFRPINRPNIYQGFKQKQERHYNNEQYGRHGPFTQFTKSSDSNYVKHYSPGIGNNPPKYNRNVPLSYARQEAYTPRIQSNTQSYSPRESRIFRGYMNDFNSYDVEASEPQSQASRRGSLKSIIDKDITPLINSINNNVSNNTSNAQHIIHWYFIIPNQANADPFFVWKNTSVPATNREAEDSPESDLKSPILTAPAQLSENETSAENRTMDNSTTTTSTSSTTTTNTSTENNKLIWNSTEYEYDDEIWHKNQWAYISPPTIPKGTVITKRPKIPSKWPWDIVHHHHQHKPNKYPRKTWPWPETVSCSCNKWYVPSRGWWPSRTSPMMPGMSGWDKK